MAIAFGIGTFTLSLPIPEDCPTAFKELLTGTALSECVGLTMVALHSCKHVVWFLLG